MPPLHPFLPVPGVVRLALEGNQAGRPFANIFHVQYTGAAPTAANLDTWAGTWYTSVTGTLAAQAHTTATYTSVTATDLSSITGAQVTAGGPAPGALAGDTIPSNSAGLINWNSSFRYRGGHPRTYLVAGVQTSLLNPNTWTDGFTGNLNDCADSIRAAAATPGTGFDATGPCAVSYRQASAPDGYRLVPLVMPIATGVASSGIATMRRRMRK
jgi:hypothetical protein